MSEFMLIQLGRRLKFTEVGLTNPAEVGVTRLDRYRDHTMTESDMWTVIKVFNRDESRKLIGLKYLLGYEEWIKLLGSLFEIETLNN